MLVLFVLATTIYGCKKDQQESYITKDFFYRLLAFDEGGAVIDSSYIVSTKINVGTITGEFRTTTYTEDHPHYDGDGCNENDDKFCQKHPWHKKCPKQILELNMDQLVAQRNYDHIAITWRMVNEGSIYEFGVQRSQDAKNFSTIKRVRSKGSNTLYTIKDYNR